MLLPRASPESLAPNMVGKARKTNPHSCLCAVHRQVTASEHLRRLQSHPPLSFMRDLIKLFQEDEEGVVKAITHLPPEAGTMGGDPASNL